MLHAIANKLSLEGEDNLRQISEEEIDAEIILHEFRAGFASWKESTLTSPSKRHLGHYKALFAADSWDEEKDGPDLRERILQIPHRILQIALRLGRPPPRWTNCISCILEKDPGSPKLTRLRIIHLYEADLNLMMKILW